MHVTSAWLAGLAGAALTNALTLEKRDSPSVVTMPLKAEYGNSHARRLSKRKSIVNGEFDDFMGSSSVSYLGNITFGTPKQNLEAYFSISGRGSWLQSAIASDSYCEGEETDCNGGEGAYNKTASTSAKLLDERFYINDTNLGLFVSGEMVSDTLTFAGASLDEVNIAIIDKFSYATNMLNIGYGDDDNVTSLTRELASSGTIQSEAFSLYNQTVIFGGVNKARWEGELYSFPIINATSDNKPAEIAISIDGIAISSNFTPTNALFPMSAILDNMYTVSYVPKSVAQVLNAQISGASAPDSYGMVNFSCGAVSEDDSIQFKFGYLELDLRLIDFVDINAWGPDHVPPTSKDSNETCFFQILENTGVDNVGMYLGENEVLLGAHFFEKVYSVFDFTNDKVSLASLNSDSAFLADDIVEITADTTPGAVAGDSEESAGVRIGRDMSMSALVATAAVLFLAL